MTPQEKREYRRALWKLYNFTPHSKQEEALDSEAKYVIMACGKKAGKTTTLVHKCIEVALSPPTESDLLTGMEYGLPKGFIYIGIISISYDQCRLSFNQVVRKLQEKGVKLTVDHFKSNPGDVEFINDFGATVKIKCFSTVEPDHLRGSKWSFVAMDEAAYMQQDIWDSYINVNVRKVFIATSPNGKNWVHDFYRQGKTPNDIYHGLQFDTFVNDRQPREDYDSLVLEAERLKRLAPLIYRQDILGEFVDASSGFFGDWEKKINYKLHWDSDSGVIRPYEGGMYYVIGVDLAKYRDFTVVDVFNCYRQHCYHKKFGHEAWSLQLPKLVNVARMYPGKMVVDQTGVGDPIVERLITEYHVDTEGIVMDYKRKMAILTELNIALSASNEMDIAPIPDIMQGLGDVVTTMSKSGRTLVGDSSGHVPDEVAAMALAMYGLRSFPYFHDQAFRYGSGEVPALDDFGKPIYEEIEKQRRPLWRPGHREPIWAVVKEELHGGN